MESLTRISASRLFAALSNPTRLRIVEMLSSGEHPVNEIANEIGIGQSGASQHLAILTRAGAIVVQPRGAARYYRIRGPRIVQVLHLIEEFCQVHGLTDAVEEEPDNEVQMDFVHSSANDG